MRMTYGKVCKLLGLCRVIEEEGQQAVCSDCYGVQATHNTAGRMNLSLASSVWCRTGLLRQHSPFWHQRHLKLIFYQRF